MATRAEPTPVASVNDDDYQVLFVFTGKVDNGAVELKPFRLHAELPEAG